ncbi:MAG: riboflavin kinase, partial [Weeksellaceae bacterium]
LGYDYFIQGQVIRGDGIGKKLGFPTINIQAEKKKLIPKDGVYGVKVKFDDQVYDGLMSIGDRPTFEGKDRRLEVFILDFEGDLYTKEVRVEFLYYIREQLKFESTEELIYAMREDELLFKKWIELHS